MGRDITLTDVIVFFLVIISLNFFFASFALQTIFKAIIYGSTLLMIALSVLYFFDERGGFVLPIQVISVSLVFSIVMADITWGQPMSFAGSLVPYLVWFVFFYLLHIRYPVEKIEFIMMLYGCIYICLYLFQFAHKEIVYFGFQQEFTEDRGIARINFPGGGVFFLSYFIALTKTKEGSRFSWFFILFLVAGFIVTVMQVTRQSIALIVVVTGYHLLKTGSMQRIVIASLLALLVVFYFLFSDNSISKGLKETQKQTVAEGSQYIRVLAAEYYAFDFAPTTLARIFGNGYPNDLSNYGRYLVLMQENYGFFLADVGLIGLYAMFGILPVIAYVIMFYKGFRLHVPEKNMYVKYYLFFLLITCLTSDYTYSINFLIANVFVFYILQLRYEQQFD